MEDRSLQHEVYVVIIEWIHRGELRPGDRVSEAAIARHLGVSRGPVRDAISRLDYEGLLVRRPRRGPIVPEFTAKDVDDIVSARQLLEGHTARCATQRLTAEDVDKLEQVIDLMAAAARAGRWTDTALLNARFHETVVRIANNNILARMWRAFHPLAWLLAPISSPHTAHDPERLVTRHQALLQALQSGDLDRAETAFRQHILDASRRGASHVASQQQTDFTPANGLSNVDPEPSPVRIPAPR